MKRTSRKISAEHKAKISKAKKGKALTQEHKAKISESMKAYWETIPID